MFEVLGSFLLTVVGRLLRNCLLVATLMFVTRGKWMKGVWNSNLAKEERAVLDWIGKAAVIL